MMISMARFKRVGLTIKSELSEKDELVSRVLAVLERERIDVCIDRKRLSGVTCTKGLKNLSRSRIDLLIVIGGDGTMVRAVRELQTRRIPLLGINRGNIGFLAEIDVGEIESVLPALLRGHGTIEERHLLSVTVHRGRSSVAFRERALNEAVIAQGAIARLLDLKTTVRTEPLTTYRADGLIIATPTGSTAYSLSAGGPIVHPRLPALILTPINPHSFSQKPIVLPGTYTVEVEVVHRERTSRDYEVSLTLDGQVYEHLQPNDRIAIRMDDETVPFLRRTRDTFFHTLRGKLKWGETIEG